MTKRRTTEQPVAKPSGYPRKQIPCRAGKDIAETGRNFAEVVTSPELAAYRIIGVAQPKAVADDIDAPGMLEALRDQAAAVNGGDLSQAEAMLINQASALQALFVRLTERATEQTLMPNYEGFMRLALRAQSQCRSTLETLATIKNPPPVAFVKQANIAAGPQQINNGVAPETSRAGENENQQSKQSEVNHELLPDTRASSLAGGINPQMETLGKIDRAKVKRG